MPRPPRVPPAGESSLTIGELAEATGVSVTTLRSWEQRHGFPEPLRLESRHRRYSADDVDAVREVLRRRRAGARLDAAVEQVRALVRSPERPAVFARTTRAYPAEPRQRLRKSTLVAVSHAIEDEAVATAQHAHLFASFQAERHFLAVRDRWAEIARVAASAHVFADFSDDRAAGGAAGPVRVRLPGDAPMLREWAMVCDAPDLSVALLAWEPPGQDGVPDRARVFEVIWTVDAGVVRDAARWSAEAAAAAGSPTAAELLAGPLAGPPVTTALAPLAVSRLVQRILGEVEAESGTA